MQNSGAPFEVPDIYSHTAATVPANLHYSVKEGIGCRKWTIGNNFNPFPNEAHCFIWSKVACTQAVMSPLDQANCLMIVDVAFQMFFSSTTAIPSRCAR